MRRTEALAPSRFVLKNNHDFLFNVRYIIHGEHEYKLIDNMISCSCFIFLPRICFHTRLVRPIFQLSNISSGRLITLVESIFMDMARLAWCILCCCPLGLRRRLRWSSSRTLTFTFDACSTVSLSFLLMGSFSSFWTWTHLGFSLSRPTTSWLSAPERLKSRASGILPPSETSIPLTLEEQKRIFLSEDKKARAFCVLMVSDASSCF